MIKIKAGIYYTPVGGSGILDRQYGSSAVEA
jgi:hypothetical protein